LTHWISLPTPLIIAPSVRSTSKIQLHKIIMINNYNKEKTPMGVSPFFTIPSN
jgi:hypothetical protein